MFVTLLKHLHGLDQAIDGFFRFCKPNKNSGTECLLDGSSDPQIDFCLKGKCMIEGIKLVLDDAVNSLNLIKTQTMS